MSHFLASTEFIIFIIEPSQSKKIKEFLSKDNSYTLHSKSFKRQYNPSFIRYKGQQIQADLIDITNLSQLNNGTKFLLTIICSFTKKAWISPLKSKKNQVQF